MIALCTAARADDGAFTPSLLYNGDLVSNLSGGANRGIVYAGALQAQLHADLDKAFGWRGLTVFADGLATHGGSPLALVGDAQGVSNIAAPPDIVVYEAWLQYNVPGVPFSVLAGRYDLNTEFDVVESASVLLNSSFGIGADFGLSGAAGPSIYPDTALGLRLEYKPGEETVIRFAALDGAPVDCPGHRWGLFEKGDGVLLAGEVSFLTRSDPIPDVMRTNLGRLSRLPPYDSKLAIGGWYYTARFDDRRVRQPDGMAVRRRGSGGIYAIADQTLLSKGDAKLTGFVQLSAGDDRVNRFGGYIGLGFAASGFVPGRSGDVIGLGVAMARSAGHFKEAQADPAAAETSIELTYYAPVTGWLALHPDIQYVVHPGTSSAVGNAMVLQLQFEIST